MSQGEGEWSGRKRTKDEGGLRKIKVTSVRDVGKECGTRTIEGKDLVQAIQGQYWAVGTRDNVGRRAGLADWIEPIVNSCLQEGVVTNI